MLVSGRKEVRKKELEFVEERKEGKGRMEGWLRRGEGNRKEEVATAGHKGIERKATGTGMAEGREGEERLAPRWTLSRCKKH